MGVARNLTISRLLKVIREEEYGIVFKKWVGKNYLWLGECDAHKLKIAINYNRIYKLPRTEKRILFVHEFLHAYMDTMFINPSVDRYFSAKDEEVIVEALAQKICNNASPKKLEMLDRFIDYHLKKADKQFNNMTSSEKRQFKKKKSKKRCS